MKKLLFFFSTILLLTAISCGEGGMTGDDDNFLATEMDSMCYAVGASFSKSMVGSPIEMIGEQISKGYMDCKSGASYISEDNADEVTMKLQNEFMKMQMDTSGSATPSMDLDSISYAIGSTYFLQLKSIGMELKDEALAKGIQDYFEEEGGLLDDMQIQSLMARFGVLAESASAEKAAADAEANKAEAVAFLEEKANEEDVQATGTGLLYKVIKEGSGKMPKASDTVKVHYEGRLIDGTVFDSSIARGEPIEFPLGGVIKGWTEGLQLMKTGAKYQFYIPSDLAYGDRGAGPDIGPGATLIFDVELLEVK